MLPIPVGQEDEMKARFVELVNRHDLTYAYSDDHRVWRNGEAQRREINEIARQLDADFVKKTWNAMVDRTIISGSRGSWYWK